MEASLDSNACPFLACTKQWPFQYCSSTRFNLTYRYWYDHWKSTWRSSHNHEKWHCRGCTILRRSEKQPLRYHKWGRNSHYSRKQFLGVLRRDWQTTALLLSRWRKRSWMQSRVWQNRRLLRHRKQQCMLSFRIRVVPDSKLWLPRWLHRLEQLSGWEHLESD